MKHLLPLFTTTFLSFLPSIVQAQTYTPSNRTPQADNSIGTVVINSGANNFNITGGLQRGQNLFHSFTDFSIPTGGAANFTNPAGNQSIITRITGNLFSDLNGTLNTNGANFLLINPNGVVFGTGVRLDVGKAFVTSTASGVDFLDAAGRTYNFEVNRAGDAPLISIAPNVAFSPVRLIMNASIPGSKGTENYGTLQTNNPGQYVGLIGGDVNFYGGQIIVPGAKVELGGLVQGGLIGFSLDNGIQLPANVERGNVSLVQIETSPSIIDVRSGGGGSVGIVATDINLKGTGTRIRAGIAEGLGSPTAKAGDIKLDATRNISFSDRAAIVNRVNSGAQGNAGMIEILTRNLSVTNGAQIVTSTLGKGDAGNIKIIAGGNVFFDGVKDSFSSAAASTVAPGAKGNGGEIEIVTGNLSITNGAVLSASTSGTRDAGNIKIIATGNISFDGYTDIFRSAAASTIQPGGEGKAGDIEISAANISVTNGALVSVSTFGNGDAGNIKIITSGNIFFDGGIDALRSAALSRVEEGAEGKAGGIEIVTRNLSVTNGAGLTVSTLGKGDAGKLQIIASENVSFDGVKDDFGSNALSGVEIGAEGKAGGMEIVTRNLSVTNGAALISSTFGKGDAGNIKITATENISFDGGGAVSRVEMGAEGNGGGIEIVTRNLSVTNGGQLQALTKGKGNAGNIKIASAEKVLFDGGKDGFGSDALSTVQPGAEGNGGGIEILTGNLLITNDAALTVGNYGKGNAGDIFLKSTTVTLDKGEILSKSTSSTGGNINLFTTDYLLLRNNSVIATDSDSTGKNGNGGNITINSPLIIATPGNNDITANAYQGDGGKVNITSQGLFGIQYRPIGSEFTNDITASSTFGQSGSVQINTPGIDPGKDTGELPAAPNDASNQISQTCGASQRENKFYITGRGGLPPNASEPQESEALWQDGREVKTQTAPTANLPQKFAPPAIGWVFQKNGTVRLVSARIEGGTMGTKVVCPNK